MSEARIALSRPIQAFGAEVKELALREPLFRDVRGVMFTVTPEGARFDLGALIPLIARLSNTPEAAIETMGMVDVSAVVAAVIPLSLAGAAGVGAPPPPAS